MFSFDCVCIMMYHNITFYFERDDRYERVTDYFLLTLIHVFHTYCSSEKGNVVKKIFLRLGSTSHQLNDGDVF